MHAFKKKILFISLILTGIISIVSGICALIKPNDIAYINRVPISEREFELLLNSNKAKIISELYHDNVKMSDDLFWHTKINGKTPAEYLCEKTLQDCIRNKSIQLLACKYNVLTDCSYDVFLKVLSKENQTRRQKLLKNEPIYGPDQYTEETYYEQYILDISQEIQKKLAEQSADDDFNLYKEYFEEIKDQFFKREDSVKILIMDIPKQTSYQNAQKYYNRIKDLISQGRSIDAQLKQFDIASDTVVLDENSIRYYSMYDPKTLEIGYTLRQNGLSELYKVKDHYRILLCVKRDTEGYDDYKSVEDVVKAKFHKKQFEVLLQNQMNEQSVKITRLFEEYKTNYKGGR